MSLSYSQVGLSSWTEVESVLHGAPPLYDERAYPATDGTYNVVVTYECRWVRTNPTQSGWDAVAVRIDAKGCDAVWSWRIVDGFWVADIGGEEMPPWVAESVGDLRPSGHVNPPFPRRP